MMNIYIKTLYKMSAIKKTKALMQKHGISAYRLSKMTGIAESTLSRWLNGKSEIKLSNYEKIQKAIKELI